MKQNFTIMFHPTHNSLTNRLRRAALLSSFLIASASQAVKSEEPPQQYYNPEAGFKPAQTGLADILRQLAGSLEHHESPMPYLRHVKGEHDRIAGKYRAAKGKEMTSFLPSYMDDTYLDEMQKSWDELAVNLTLDKLSKESGKLLHLAIDGDNGKGTPLVLLCNWHQDRVFEDMTSEGKREVGFKQLKQELLTLAREGDSGFLAKRETKLSQSEGEVFQSLIEKSKFNKSDFATLEEFYGNPHDRLSDYGKSLLSQRVFAGQRGEGVSPSDAEKYSAEMLLRFETLFGKFDNQLSPENSSELKRWVSGVIAEVLYAAQNEYEIGIQEWILSE